ncbi:hypothetical protein H8356DRAFT_1427789 [Neocallimastix lanati (nom. inval.)]|nr:hypothetical protein H8356DRAFT_1427789 [Neocallimastix sp. JGI-2020a]
MVTTVVDIEGSQYGYKFDARKTVLKGILIVKEKNGNPRLEHWFSKCYLFREFRKKYFKDIEILYEKFYIISKYCPISNSNVDTVITDMNNIELSSDSDSSNEVYNINKINNRNNIVNNSDSENFNIVAINLVNSSIGENRANLKRKWDILFKNQIISGDYSKTPFLVLSAALLIQIMSVNAENASIQTLIHKEIKVRNN